MKPTQVLTIIQELYNKMNVKIMVKYLKHLIFLYINIGINIYNFKLNCNIIKIDK